MSVKAWLAAGAKPIRNFGYIGVSKVSLLIVSRPIPTTKPFGFSQNSGSFYLSDSNLSVALRLR
jgi:hypothetical protein